jgi:hypothetical protein
MHHNLYREFLLATALFLTAFCIFLTMVIAAVVSIIREYGLKRKPVPKPNRWLRFAVGRAQNFFRK